MDWVVDIMRSILRILKHKELKRKNLVFADRWRDETGATTEAMAISLMLCMLLMFGSIQVYRTQSSAAHIQDIADAAALAAENEVAEFMIAVRICDAAVLSMSLFSYSLSGLGAICLCIPPAAEMGEALLKAGKDTLNARDTFADQAARGLNAFQKALPYIAAAQAASVAADNARGKGDNPLYAVALLVPSQGKEITVDLNHEKEDELQDEIERNKDEIREKAQEAEEAAQKAADIKERAYKADCGNTPEACMEERATRLASLKGSDNPHYQSCDTWSFSVALKRAQTYYAARWKAEDPESYDSSEQQANSVLRKRFYAYAFNRLKEGYVIETQDHFEASFPVIYRSTEQMKHTSLYDEELYPITRKGDQQTMHAWTGCEGVDEVVGTGSIRRLYEGRFKTCEYCKFVPASLGNVAAMTSVVPTGFEYHYNLVAELADEYQKERAKIDPLKGEVKDKTKGIFDQ